MLDESLVTIGSTQIVNQAEIDGQVLALWIHGRSKHTQRAYSAKADRFRLLNLTIHEAIVCDQNRYEEVISSSGRHGPDQRH